MKNLFAILILLTVATAYGQTTNRFDYLKAHGVISRTASETNKFARGDGTFQDVSSGGSNVVDTLADTLVAGQATGTNSIILQTLSAEPGATNIGVHLYSLAVQGRTIPSITLSNGYTERLLPGIVLGKNSTGGTLTPGTAVYSDAAVGSEWSMNHLAIATNLNTCTQFVSAETLAPNAWGLFARFGTFVIGSVSFSETDRLYLSDTVEGLLTNVAPTASTSFRQLCGDVKRTHPTLGAYGVDIHDPQQLDLITGVTITNDPSQSAGTILGSSPGTVFGVGSGPPATTITGFSAYHSTNRTISSSVFTEVTNIKTADHKFVWSTVGSQFNPATGRWTPPANTTNQVMVNAEIDNIGDGVLVIVGVMTNGYPYADATFVQSGNSTGFGGGGNSFIVTGDGTTAYSMFVFVSAGTPVIRGIAGDRLTTFFQGRQLP